MIVEDYCGISKRINEMVNTELQTNSRATSRIAHERDLVRELARQVAAIATSEENEVIVKRWSDVNALRKPDRAPVWCRPVGCWSELLPEDTIVCQDPWLRGLEYNYRQILLKNDIGDDSPLDPYFAVNAVFDLVPKNRWGVEIGRHNSAEDGGSWAYDPPLKSEADFDKLQMPTFTYNDAETQRRLEQTEELLGDILPVKLVCGPGYDSATLGTAAAELRGLTEMMMDTIVEPQLLHRLMAHIRDAQMRRLDAWENSSILTPNNCGPMLCSDPVGGEPKDEKYTLKNCWCAGNSQEFDQVSPEMWEEFCLQYQKPIFERFGYVCYGCCENLTHKIDGVLSIPNLRIFVVSAWTSMDVVLERVGPEYCIMWRQKASDVVFPNDNETIRRDLNDGANRLQGRPYQIVLRELQTLCGHMDRLHVWTELAKEAAAKYA